MRYIPGGDLGKLLRESGALSIGSALDVATAIARALAAGHAHGLVHRDVKPANILLESAAGHLHPYLSDFGLSTLVGHRSSISSAAGMVGTLHYMAPEQIRGEDVDARADVYSLGCLLYECLTATTPFAGSEVAVMLAHLDQQPPRPSDTRPEISPELDAIVLRAMAKDKSDRYATMRELIDALRAIQPEAGKARSTRSRRRSMAAAIALVLGIAGVAVAVERLQVPAPRRPATAVLGPLGTLVYSTNRGLFEASPGGSVIRRVTRNGDFPAFSPDGRSIAFVRPHGGFGSTGSLFAMDRDGAGLRELTHGHLEVGSEDAGLGPVGWSSDGRQIAFVSSKRLGSPFPGAAATIIAVPLEGSGGHRLVETCPDSPKTAVRYVACVRRNPLHPACTYTHGLPTCYPARLAAPAWSPSDRQIAFSASHGRAGSALWLVDVHTGDLQMIRDGLPQLQEQDDPSWAPDGRRLAFDSCRRGQFCSIYTITPAGTSLRKLPAGTNDAFAPAWSPDGSYIAYVCRFNGVNSICMMRADGTARRVVIRGSARLAIGSVAWGR
jgi:protein kinase-like protein/WD40 repeat protein